MVFTMSCSSFKGNLEAIKKKYKSIQKKIANSEKYSSELEDQMAELDGKQLDTQHSLDLQETAINEGKDDFMERIRSIRIMKFIKEILLIEISFTYS